LIFHQEGTGNKYFRNIKFIKKIFLLLFNKKLSGLMMTPSAVIEEKKIVEIFKTDVSTISDANSIIKKLRMHFPSFRINFDLNDCDKILRLEAKSDIEIDKIVKIVKNLNFKIELVK